MLCNLGRLSRLRKNAETHPVPLPASSPLALLCLLRPSEGPAFSWQLHLVSTNGNPWYFSLLAPNHGDVGQALLAWQFQQLSLYPLHL